MTEQANGPSSPNDPAAQTAAALVAFAGCEIVPINGSMSLVMNGAQRTQSVLSPDVLSALGACGQFATVSEHAQAICHSQANLRGQESRVAGTLQQLASAGLLARDEQVRARLSTGAERSLAATRIAIITADRPALLERLLESMLRQGSLLPFNHLLLIDDSQQEDKAGRNAELVEQFNTRSPRDMQYFGRAEQRALTDALHSTCPDARQAIDTLLNPDRWPAGQRYGRARSLALLLTVGHRCIVLDDDILCQAVASPFKEPGLRIGSSRERMALFAPDQDALLQSAHRLDASPLALHADALGRPIGTLVDKFGPLALEGSPAAAALELDGRAPVLLTQCGSWGDPGTADPHWVLQLRRDAIERLAASGDLRSLIEARCCWFGCTRPTLMKAGFMSQMTGLDNSALLPPYFPAFRGEDQLFGSMLNALYPNAAALEFDWGVPHLPEATRERLSLRAPIPRRASLGLAARLVDSLVDYSSDESPEERLQYLSLQLRRLTRRGVADIEQMYRSVLATARAEQLQSLATVARETSELPSSTWQGYLRRAVEEVQHALARYESLGDALGMCDDHGAAAGRLLETTRDFAEVIDAWPSLRSAAAELALAEPR